MSEAMVGMMRSITLGLVVALVPWGCAPATDWTGTWEGKREISVPQGADPSIAATLSSVSLTIEPDGSFKLVEEGIDFEGTAILGSEKGTLTIRRVLGRPTSALSGQMKEATQDRTIRMSKNLTVSLETPGLEDVTLSRSKAH